MKIMAKENAYGSLTFYVLDEEGIGIPILSQSTAYRLLKPEYISVFYNENWTEWTTTFLSHNDTWRELLIKSSITHNVPQVIEACAKH